MKKIIMALVILGIAFMYSGIALADLGDGFENYPVGQFPSENWTPSGNTNSYIVDTISYSGEKSFRLHGSLGGCWAAIAYREYTAIAPFYVECAVYNGSESLSGCNPDRGYITLKTCPDWTCSGRKFIKFCGDGKIVGGGGLELGTYFSETWYEVRIKYEIIAGTTVRLSYWINDEFKGQENLSKYPWEGDLSYLGITALEGTVWFDDIKVTSASPATIGINPGTLNLKSKGNWITAYIELPEDYSVEDIDINSIILSKINGNLIDPPLYTVGPSEIGDYDGNDISDLMLKFDRQELIPLLEVGDAELIVSGELVDGLMFEGTDTIRVIDKGKK